MNQAEHIRRSRLESQEDVAERAGLDVRAVRRVEKGRDVQPKTMAALCDALEWPRERWKELYEETADV